MSGEEICSLHLIDIFLIGANNRNSFVKSVLIWGMWSKNRALVWNHSFPFAEPCLCRTLWEGPFRCPPWPGPSPPRRPSPPTCLHVSTCVIISSSHWWWSGWFGVDCRHAYKAPQQSHPRGRERADDVLITFNVQRVVSITKLTMFPTSEFLKIKEKQKAWKVDNGLRVHEVTFPFIPWSHVKDKRMTWIFHNINDEISKVQPCIFWMMGWDFIGTLFHATFFQRGSTDKILMAACNILMVSKRLKLCLKSISALYSMRLCQHLTTTLMWRLLVPLCGSRPCTWWASPRVFSNRLHLHFMTPPLVRISSFDSTFNLMSRHLSRFIQ